MVEAPTKFPREALSPAGTASLSTLTVLAGTSTIALATESVVPRQILREHLPDATRLPQVDVSRN